MSSTRNSRSSGSTDLHVLKELDNNLSTHIQLTTSWKKKLFAWSEELDKENNNLMEMKAKLSKVIHEHDNTNVVDRIASIEHGCVSSGI